MNRAKKLVVSLILVIISMICILVGVIIYLQQKNEERIAQGDIGEVFDFSQETVKPVESQIRYYTVSNCVNQYLDLINSKNDNYYARDDNNQYVRVISEEKVRDMAYNILSKKYIESNNITKKNISDYIQRVDQKLLFTPLKMNVLENSPLEQYVVYGYLQTLTNQYVSDFYIIVNLDVLNKTYSIQPILKKMNGIDEIALTKYNDPIEENDNNKYQDAKINFEIVANNYLMQYKRMALTKPEYAYQYFSKEYAEKRFHDLEGYQKYVEKNKQEIQQIQFTKYLINNYEGYVQYVCRDQYDNLYIFEEKKPLDYTVQLDTYTLDNTKFVQTYQNSSEAERVMMNIDKWMQMINNRDYSSAFKVLDETFRKNTFQDSESKFEEYMRTYFSSHYRLEYEESSSETGLFVQNVVFYDLVDKNKLGVNRSFVMELKNDLEFALSFNLLIH